MNCVELFAGCGGAALGLRTAGLRHLLFVEAAPLAVLSLMANFPGVPVCTKNLFLYSVEEVFQEHGITCDFDGMVWLSPPCQGVSSGGPKNAPGDVRNNLLFAAVAAARYAPNAWIVVENVTGLAKGNAKPIYEELLRRLSAARGVATWELRSVEWGCAQDRNRLFIIAAPVGKKVPPQPLPPEGTVEKFVKDEMVGFVDHDPDFFPLADNELPIYAQIGDGQNWKNSELGKKYADMRGFRGKKKQFLSRIDTAAHWPCQFASPPRAYGCRTDFVHPTELRHVTVGEAKHMMGLPQAYLLAGNAESRYRQAGNAVMPFMAEVVAKAIISADSGTPLPAGDGQSPSDGGTPCNSTTDVPGGLPPSAPAPTPESESHPVVEVAPSPLAPKSDAMPIACRESMAAMGKAGLMPELITTYAEFDEMVRAFDEGLIGFLVFVGSHGLGKTERFRRFRNLAYVNNSASARGIYEWAMNNIDKALVLDDLDGLLKVREVIALLKALCETRDVKTVSLTKRLPKGVPSQFQTRSHVCLGCNALPELNADLTALLDRARLVVFAPNAQEVHRHVGEWFRNREVYEFIGYHLDQIPVPSIRLYRKIDEFSRQYANWREQASRLLGLNGASQDAPARTAPADVASAAVMPPMAPEIDTIVQDDAQNAPKTALAKTPESSAFSLGDGRVLSSTSHDESEIIASIVSLYCNGRRLAVDDSEQCIQPPPLAITAWASIRIRSASSP